MESKRNNNAQPPEKKSDDEGGERMARLLQGERYRRENRRGKLELGIME